MNWQNFAHGARTALIAIGAATALGAVAVPALAQDSDDIIVTAPYEVHHYTTGRTATGARIETSTLSRVVSARDLDLRDDAAVDELHRRVVYTARVACDQLDRRSMDISLTTDRECVNQALYDAAPQERALVERARY